MFMLQNEERDVELDDLPREVNLFVVESSLHFVHRIYVQNCAFYGQLTILT